MILTTRDQHQSDQMTKLSGLLMQEKITQLQPFNYKQMSKKSSSRIS